MSNRVVPDALRSRPLPFALALGLPSVALLVIRWFDRDELVRLQHESGSSFDLGPIMNGLSVAHVLTPALILAIAFVAWRARSALVGIVYVLVGGLLAFSPALTAAFAVSTNNAPTPAPEPIAHFLADTFFLWEDGITNAVGTVGGAILIVGLAVLARVTTDRRDRNVPHSMSEGTGAEFA